MEKNSCQFEYFQDQRIQENFRKDYHVINQMNFNPFKIQFIVQPIQMFEKEEEDARSLKFYLLAFLYLMKLVY